MHFFTQSKRIANMTVDVSKYGHFSRFHLVQPFYSGSHKVTSKVRSNVRRRVENELREGFGEHLSLSLSPDTSLLYIDEKRQNSIAAIRRIQSLFSIKESLRNPQSRSDMLSHDAQNQCSLEMDIVYARRSRCSFVVYAVKITKSLSCPSIGQYASILKKELKSMFKLRRATGRPSILPIEIRNKIYDTSFTGVWESFGGLNLASVTGWCIRTSRVCAARATLSNSQAKVR